MTLPDLSVFQGLFLNQCKQYFASNIQISVFCIILYATPTVLLLFVLLNIYVNQNFHEAWKKLLEKNTIHDQQMSFLFLFMQMWNTPDKTLKVTYHFMCFLNNGWHLNWLWNDSMSSLFCKSAVMYRLRNRITHCFVLVLAYLFKELCSMHFCYLYIHNQLYVLS